MVKRFWPLTFVFVLAMTATVNAAEYEYPVGFASCKSCHTVAKAGDYQVGPSLAGLIGRKVASLKGFDYSEALKADGGIWTVEKLDTFLQRPNHAIPGTRMFFRGLSNDRMRRELVAWIANGNVPTVVQPTSKPRTFGPREREKVQSVTDRQTQLLIPCIKCHHFYEGAPPSIGPGLYGVYGRKIGSFPGYEYSDKLLGRNGVWDEDSLEAFFTEKMMFEQGTHFAFKRLKSKKDRELVIAFLKSQSVDNEKGAE